MLKSWVVLKRSVHVTARAGAILLSKVQIDGANLSNELSVSLIDEKVGGHALRLPAQIELERVFLHVILQPSYQKLVWPICGTYVQVRLIATQRLSCSRMS